MGRPINKKFFANANEGEGVGGEGVASVTIAGEFSGFTALTTTVTFSAPQIPGGQTATGTATIVASSPPQETFVVTVVNDGGGNVFVIDGVNKPVLDLQRGGVYTFVQSAASNSGHQLAFKDGAGNSYTTGVVTTGTPGNAGAQTVITVASDAPADLRYYCVAHGNYMGNTITVTNTEGDVTAIVITDSGSGYTAVPTVTIADSDVGAEVTTGTATAVLTIGAAARQNGITVSAFVPGGASAAVGDIIKQTASRSYRVITAQGTGRCDLVAAAPTAGQMTMTAVDSVGGTYYVIKLTARRALLIKGDRSGTEFTTGTAGISIPWSFDAAVLNERVQILNA